MRFGCYEWCRVFGSRKGPKGSLPRFPWAAVERKTFSLSLCFYCVCLITRTSTLASLSSLLCWQTNTTLPLSYISHLRFTSNFDTATPHLYTAKSHRHIFDKRRNEGSEVGRGTLALVDRLDCSSYIDLQPHPRHLSCDKSCQHVSISPASR